MQNQLSELQGEVLALRCFLAALITSLPLGVQLRAYPAFDRHADLVRDQLSAVETGGFDRAFTSIKAREAVSASVASHPSVAACRS